MVYFAKDAVLVGVYIGFWLYGPGCRRRSMPPQWLPLAGIKLSLIPITLLALNPSTGSVTASLLGMRGYFFYLPIILIVPYIFRDRSAMLREMAIYTMMAIPVCLLGVIQFRSDSFSVINTYASGTSEFGAATFGGAAGQVRVTGTFSYLTGHVVFVTTFVALAIAQIANAKTPFRRTIIYIVIPLLLGNVLMTGSRAAFITCAATLIGFAANKMGTVSTAGRWRAFKVTAAVSGVVVLACVYAFSDAANALHGRANAANDSLVGRLVEMPIHHLNQGWDDGGISGCGIGTTSAATAALRRRLGIPDPQTIPQAYDMEIGSVFAEIGLLGFVCWYAFRLLILGSLWSMYQRCRDEQLRPVILSTFLISIPFFVQSLVLNHVACVLVWGMTGLSLAACRFSQKATVESRSRQSSHPANMRAAARREMAATGRCA